MKEKAPPPRASLWWRRGILDGKSAAYKRRGRFFPLYLAKAIEALNPGELIGPCECVYRVAFRYGWDDAKEARIRRNTFSPRPKKRGNLRQS